MSRVPMTLTPLSPLVARFGSDSNAERLACLCQIDRVFNRSGISWFDLAGRLTWGASATEPVLSHWRFAVQWIIAHPDWCRTERERTFITDMRRILKRPQPSEKQAAWVAIVVGELGGRIGA